MNQESAADYFTSYVQCYDNFDVVELAKYYFAPTLMVKICSVTPLLTANEIFDHLAGLLASYKEHGYQMMVNFARGVLLIY